MLLFEIDVCLHVLAIVTAVIHQMPFVFIVVVGVLFNLNIVIHGVMM